MADESPSSELPESVSVKDLRPTTSGHNLTVKVVEAKVVVDRQPRGPKGSSLRIAECLVGDPTGLILLSARNDQVDVATKGAYVTLRNAKVSMYRGSMRLAVDQSGSMEPCSDAAFKPNEDTNMSLIEFELIPVP